MKTPQKNQMEIFFLTLSIKTNVGIKPIFKMKSFKIFTFVLLTSLVLFSCKKDKDNLPEPSNEDVTSWIEGTYLGVNTNTSEAMTIQVEAIDKSTVALSCAPFAPITFVVIKNPSDANIVNNEFGQNDGITAVFNLSEKLLTLIDEQQEFSFSGNRED